MASVDHVKIIEKFGGVYPLKRLLGHEHPTTVQAWKKRKFIPVRHWPRLLELAKDNGIDLAEADFFPAKPDKGRQPS